MRLIFRVRFHTHPGQSLLLTGNHELFGNGDLTHAIPLEYVNQELWQATLVIARSTAPDSDIIYNYVLKEPDGSVVYDWGSDKVINPGTVESDSLLLVDSWNHAGLFQNAFYTEPFRHVLLRSNHTEATIERPNRVTHTFKVKSPLLVKGQTMCLLGDAVPLRNWDRSQPVVLTRKPDEDFFWAEVDLTGTSFPILYKYGVWDLEHKQFVRYEDGPNRVLHDEILQGKVTVVNDGFARLPSTTWKGAGVAIPVFSLRSEKSFGIGEFLDLKPLADWCAKTGLKLIQILPVNDTTATKTWSDSYPYAAISAFALHPIYLNLARLATGPAKSLLVELEGERKRLNSLAEVDYEPVLKAKLGFLKQIFPQQKEKLFRGKDYRTFFEENKTWLEPYAAFSCLRDGYGTSDYNQWPFHQRFTPEALAETAAGVHIPTVNPDGSAASSTTPEFYYFIQYHLHAQLREAADHAHSLGIVLKGDLPIGVYRYGSDTWQEPELYRMDMQAGAPPDPFAEKGQNWGFPTYNWPRMKQTGFAWWKRRFGQMAHYFDAFRIDHILGFFRIWSIPVDAVEGILGYFVRALPVQVSEFQARGIAFDAQQFLRPFITTPVLREIFQEQVPAVLEQFLNAVGAARYELKPHFRTQRAVEAHFAHLEQSETNQKLKNGLFDLISNVLLFEVPGSDGKSFHFRLAMENTASFRHLDAPTRAALKVLYLDYFFRRQDDFWMREALDKLPALKRVTNMLVCGEDLGMVPACVPDVMKQLGLLSLEIQRMPKQLNKDFSNPSDAPYLSVVTPSTHDMSTIRGWWEEDRALTQRFFNQQLDVAGDAPPICEPWINKAIIQQHLASPAMWSIFQIQDLLGMDEHLRRKDPASERINVPAISRYYWRYRMHLTLEQLGQAEAFNQSLKAEITTTARA